MSKSPTSSPVLVLHAHTTMSMLDGASPVEDYITYARENSHPICSCTDHGWLTGIYDLVTKAGKTQVKSVPGCEFYLQPHPDHKFSNPEKPYDYFHLTVWASKQAGLKNLIELGTKSWEGEQPITRWGKAKPRVTWANLRDHSAGLIVGSGCIEGPIGKCLLHNEMEQAWINARMLKEIFGDRLFFELMPAKVDRDYVKGASVMVRGKNGIIYRFMPDDVLVTDEGEMTATEALSKKPTEVLFVRPSRIQDGPMGGDIERPLVNPDIDLIPDGPPALPIQLYGST